jgi:hypothetical protein
MTIERTTRRLFGLRQTKKVEQVGYRTGIDIIRDPRGFPLIKEIEIISPDAIRVTEYWRNANAKDLRAIFIPQTSVVLERESINQADIHSSDSLILDKLIGIRRWSWKP